jgi:MFS family permease
VIVRPAWAAVAAAGAVLALTMGFSLVIFPVWVVAWSQEFGLPRATVMVPLALCAFAMSLCAPAVGWLIARYSARPVIVAGAIAMALGFALIANATAFWQIIVLYGTLIGLGVGLAGMLTGQTVAIQCFPAHAGAAGGLMMLGVSLGSGIMPGVIPPVLEAIGWRDTFLALAAVLAFGAVPMALFLRVPSRGAAAPLAEDQTTDGGPASPLRSSAFWFILLGILPVIIALGAIQSNLVAIGADVGISLSTASYLVTVTAVGAALGGVGVGWLADRFDPRLVYSGVAAAVILPMLALIGQRDFIVFAAALGLFGFACGGAFPLMGVLIVRTFGADRFPQVFGLIAPFLIPAVAGPVASAGIRDATGSYDLAFGMTAALMLPGVFAIWRLAAVRQPAAGAATISGGGLPSPTSTR